jgi:cysteine desulfurase
LEAVRRALESGMDLLCLMAANNEVGTIYPVDAVSREARARGCTVFVDATQAAGKIPLSVSACEIDYMALSAHKMYGPKGVGALVYAGSEGMTGRSPDGTGPGTPPVPGIVGLGQACRLRALEMEEDETRIAGLRDQLERSLCDAIPGLVVNGDRSNRLAGNLHISVPDVPGDAVIARLRRQVALSTGAACSSGAQEPSHVLRAMGLAPALQEGALRMGLGKATTGADVAAAASSIAAAVAAARLITSAAV